jgi:hypothetical protein
MWDRRAFFQSCDRLRNLSMIAKFRVNYRSCSKVSRFDGDDITHDEKAPSPEMFLGWIALFRTDWRANSHRNVRVVTRAQNHEYLPYRVGCISKRNK